MGKAARAQFMWGGPTSAADVAAAPGPPTAIVWVYVDEFDAVYRWNLGSVVAADGYRVLGHTGGSAGRWILDGARITLFPLGVGLDDWARVMAACAAMAYRGRVELAAGTWNVQTEQVTPSGTHLVMGLGCALVATLVAGAFTASIFYNDGGTSAPSVSTTLAANANPGDVTIQVADATGIAVGDRININKTPGYRRAREIVARVGNTLTLDMPLRRSWAIGDAVVRVATARDIRIEGNGATISGTGQCIVEFVSGWDCHVSGFRSSWTGVTGWPWLYDVASRNCTFEDVDCDANGACLNTFFLANCEDCYIVDCTSTRPTRANIEIASCDDCDVTRFVGSRSGLYAFYFGVEDVADTFGTRGCVFEDVIGQKAASHGLYLENGASYNAFVGCDLSYNGGSGVQVAGGTGPEVGNVWTSCQLQGNANNGLRSANAANTGECHGCNFVGNAVGAMALAAGAQWKIVGGSIVDATAGGATQELVQLLGANVQCRLVGVVATTGRNAEHFVRVNGAGARAYLEGGCLFTGTGTNEFAVAVDQGVAIVSSLRVVSPGAGCIGVWLNGAAAFARLGDAADLAGAAAPITVVAGAVNRGQVALTAAAPLAIAFGDTNATDRFFWSYVTNVGATGIVIAGAPVVGTGFNIVGLAGDTSLINYEIR